MYDKEELEIVDCIEKQNPGSVPNLSNEIDMIKSAVTKKYTEGKAIKYSC